LAYSKFRKYSSKSSFSPCKKKIKKISLKNSVFIFRIIFLPTLPPDYSIVMTKNTENTLVVSPPIQVGRGPQRLQLYLMIKMDFIKCMHCAVKQTKVPVQGEEGVKDCC
jgi:hypothetical protein